MNRMLRAPEKVMVRIRQYGKIWVETVESEDLNGEIIWYDKIYKERIRPNGLRELVLAKIIPSTRTKSLNVQHPSATYSL